MLLLDWNEITELQYYEDKEITVGCLLYQIYNCRLWNADHAKRLPLTVIVKDQWTEIPSEFKRFEIISFDKSYDENEGERNYRFVIKTQNKDYYEIINRDDSWDGPYHGKPVPVYPKQTTIYVTKENY